MKIDLSTIGAETTRVLTIADVLNAREQQVVNGPSTSFEEWESIPGSVRPGCWNIDLQCIFLCSLVN